MRFTIRSDEGLPIRGDFDLPRRTPVALAVIVHGFKGFKDWGFFPWLGESLATAGIVACRFNMSRSGIGANHEEFDRLDLFADDTYSIQLADLRSVIRYARRKYPRLPLFLLGHSRGGGVALLAAAGVRQLAGVVTWSAISHVDRWDRATIAKWRREGFLDVVNARTRQTMRMSPAILDDYDAHREELDIRTAVARLGVPLLVLHGGNDDSVPAAEAREIASRNDDTSVAILGGAGHTYNAIHPLINVPPPLSLACELTTRFIKAYS